MSIREEIRPATLQEVAGFCVLDPVRFIFKNPLRGGPPLAEVRKALAPKGKVRIFGDAEEIYADVDPEPEPPLIALGMIARSDAQGLERAILSALPHVDEIDIAVDGRSDEATKKVAQAYADRFSVFEAKDLELSDEEWVSDRIHFANARNIGRRRTQAPWTLFLDTDEKLHVTELDLRQEVANTDGQAFSIIVRERADHVDGHRLVKTEFLWQRHTHNFILFLGDSLVLPSEKIFIEHTTVFRSPAECERRFLQRKKAVRLLETDSMQSGDLSGMEQVARQYLGEKDLINAERMVNAFRSRAPIHSGWANTRSHLAIALALLHCAKNDLINAEVWAVRALFDGPNVSAMCVLGDLAEEMGDVKRALAWYEAAGTGNVPLEGILIREILDSRFSRRDELREKVKRLSNP